MVVVIKTEDFRVLAGSAGGEGLVLLQHNVCGAVVEAWVEGSGISGVGLDRVNAAATSHVSACPVRTKSVRRSE